MVSAAGLKLRLAFESGSEADARASFVLQIGDDVQQDVGAAVASLGFRRFLIKTGKYRHGDEDDCAAGRPDWVGDDFASAVESILQPGA